MKTKKASNLSSLDIARLFLEEVLSPCPEGMLLQFFEHQAPSTLLGKASQEKTLGSSRLEDFVEVLRLLYPNPASEKEGESS